MNKPALKQSPLRFPHILHGGDYNPEQWRDVPGIWDEDLRLMKLAGINAVSIGIFSWATLEPAEGKFEFGWLDRVVDNLAKNGQRIVLATPSGAKPAWMAVKYPEIRRCRSGGQRDLPGSRHNHCLTSPVYREKVQIINTKLAQRYGRHPALLLWHLSNEYGGECYCPLCLAAFRKWLRKRYGTLDALNAAWWARFWSHTITDWDQIENIDDSVHGLVLDWKRFITDQTVDFMRAEIAPLKRHAPGVPVTTNLMGSYAGLNYRKFAPHLDIMSWDSYPDWHGVLPDSETGCEVGFVHDLIRSLKNGQPYLLMESTPSQINWRPISRLKQPGMHQLSSLQAVAHGSDSVLYFQWRKSRGSSEKFHGAVVDHVGHENTRVFRDVAELGRDLAKLDAVVGTSVKPEVAIVFDWENRWAIDMAQGPRNVEKDYEATCINHYRPFWKRGIPVDIIGSEDDLSGYKLLIAPMLYMLRPGVADRIAAFVKGGGTFVVTYLSGIANETDLCFLGGWPGPLRPVLGLWVEETDVPYNHQPQTVRWHARTYAASHYCDIIHTESAKVLAKYGREFYAGTPALTVNQFGKGRAYYIASRNDGKFLDDFSAVLIRDLKIRPTLTGKLPVGVTAQRRSDGRHDFVFILNFNPKPVTVNVGHVKYRDLISGKNRSGAVKLPGYGTLVLQTSSKLPRCGG